MDSTGSQVADVGDNPPHGPCKSQLHCPVCGHESPSDGDWIAVRADGEPPSRLVTCPACESVITERPEDSRSGDGDEGKAVPAAD